MRNEQKVRLIVVLLVFIFIINSFILFGQAKDNLEEKEVLGEKKEKTESLEKDYLARGEYKRKPAISGYNNDFTVYVENIGKGDYFNVILTLKTSEGEKDYQFHRYIYSGDEERFFLRQISMEKGKYIDWRYEIE